MSGRPARLHLLDGTWELYRAQYSPRPSRVAPNGQDVKGTVGVLSSLISLLNDPDEQVTHIGIAFDNPIESFRNEMFEGYKTGEGMDPVLVAQMDLVEEAASALGLVVWSMDRWEADDALASAAVRFRASVDQVRIMTPDKDLGQCVDGQQIIQVDRMRGRFFDEAGVQERNGVLPSSIPDWLALVGDTADGIPGLAGFGARSAATLLAHYGSIEAIPSAPEDWAVKVRGAARLSATLEQQREAALLYRQLATLTTDVPLPQRDIDDLRWRGADRSTWHALMERIGGLGSQPPKWRDA